MKCLLGFLVCGCLASHGLVFAKEAAPADAGARLLNMRHPNAVLASANILCEGTVPNSAKETIKLAIDTRAGDSTTLHESGGEFLFATTDPIAVHTSFANDPRGGHLVNHRSHFFALSDPQSNSVNTVYVILEMARDTQDGNKPVVEAKLVRSPASDFDRHDMRLTCSKADL